MSLLHFSIPLFPCPACPQCEGAGDRLQCSTPMQKTLPSIYLRLKLQFICILWVSNPAQMRISLMLSFFNPTDWFFIPHARAVKPTENAHNNQPWKYVVCCPCLWHAISGKWLHILIGIYCCTSAATRRLTKSSIFPPTHKLLALHNLFRSSFLTPLNGADTATSPSRNASVTLIILALRHGE